MANTVKCTPVLFPQAYANGEQPIFIRLYHKGKRTYISSGFSIPSYFWDNEHSKVLESKPQLTKEELKTLSPEEKKQAQKAWPSASSTNNKLGKIISQLNDIAELLRLSGKEITVQIIKKQYELEQNPKYEQSGEIDLIKYIEKVASRKFDSKQIRTAEKYRVVKRKLIQFNKEKPFPLAELTTSKLEGFKTFLIKQGLHNNYVHTNLKALKTIIGKEAIKIDKVLEPEKNPFITFNMPKVKPTKKTWLTVEEIEKIKGLDFSESNKLFHIRNMFIFSLYNAGIRIGDLLALRWTQINEGRLSYTMSKTDEETSIKLLPEALEILETYRKNQASETEYIFPLLDKNAEYSKLITEKDFQKATPEFLQHYYNKLESKISACNLGLKEIAVRAGIKKRLINHTARHSYADLARTKGIPIRDISKLLRHSSVSITEAYLKQFDKEGLDNSHNNVFN